MKIISTDKAPQAIGPYLEPPPAGRGIGQEN